MSKPGGKKGAAAKAAPKVVADDLASERATPAAAKSTVVADMDVKDDVSSNGDKKDVKSVVDEANPPKPQSAGASVRDAAQKLLGLTMRQEWTPIEQVIKSLEKAVAASGDDSNLSPLAGVLDPVRIHNFNSIFCRYTSTNHLLLHCFKIN